MSLVQPFRGLRPAPGRGSDIIAPPYDVLNSAEARLRAQGKPWSFLHISKPEIDLAEDIDPYDPAVYAKAADNLQKMIEAGVLVRDEAPAYYAYRIVWGDHVQTGLVAGASVADYDTNRIRKHEFTKPAKEDDRVRQIEAVNAQTGPVMLAYPASGELDALIAAATTGTPDIDVTADDGIRHILWPIFAPEMLARITAAFDALPALYITDGHHRSAAASRVSAARIAAGDDAPDAAHRQFLTVIFPHHQLKILDYNRVITDLNGLAPDALLAAIAKVATVSESAEPARPTSPREVGMYLEARWYRLRINDHLVPADPVGRLDISLLHDNIIAPILGIADPRRDERIDFVGGIRGLEELVRRVDSGEMKVAFALYPTSLEDLMAVADADKVMPPKSTWFEPKLADGMVSLVLD